MNFLDQDFKDLKVNDEKYRDNFETRCGFIARNFFLFHTLQYLLHVKNQHDNLPENSKGLNNEHMLPLRPQDTAESISKKVYEEYQRAINKKQSGEDLTQDDVFWLIVRIFKTEVIFVLGMNIFSSFFRIAASVMMLLVFETLAVNNLERAYIYCAILLVLWYFYLLFLNVSLVGSYQLGNHMKVALSLLLYAKISKLTTYVLNSTETGTITNLVANDLEIIQTRLASITSSVNFPFLLIGMTVVLYTRIGWSVFVALAIIFLELFISNLINRWVANVVSDTNQFKDERVQLTTELIEGNKYVKMYGWELAFKKIINIARKKELKGLNKVGFGRSIDSSLGFTVGYLSTFAIYVIASEVNHSLTLAAIFSLLEMMSTIRYSIMFGTDGVAVYFELLVVYERFASFFNVKNKSMIQVDQQTKQPILKSVQKSQYEDQTNKISSSQAIMSEALLNKMQNTGEKEKNKEKRQSPNVEGRIQFKKFRGYWKDNFQKASLRIQDYMFESGVLYGISGRVGAGKSGLVGAIIGELPYYSGLFDIEGKIAYVQQEPVIFSDTVKNNIIFGRTFDQNHYDQVIKQACLLPDLKIFREGDQTIIGEKGITLSGGQKARVALARALYGPASIYIFDDPLSAVDSKVAKILFHECIQPLSRTNLVILITHQIHYIQQCDQVIIMEDGEFSAIGKPDQLKKELQELIKAFKLNQEEQEEQQQNEKQFAMSQARSHADQASSIRSAKPTDNGIKETAEEKMKKRFDEKESQVTFSTYFKFFFSSKINYILLPVTILFYVISEGVMTVYFRFLSQYDNVLISTSWFNPGSMANYWIIVGGTLIVLFFVGIVKLYCMVHVLINASEAVHDNMLQSVLRCPSKFFDKNPSGNLVNKFSTDLGTIDNILVYLMWAGVQGLIMIVVGLIVICEINLYFLIPTIIISIVVVIFYIYTRKSILACRQLDLQKKSPIIQFYSQTTGGLTQIKVYGQRKNMIKELSNILNESSKAMMGYELAGRGFSYYETIIIFILMCVGVFMGVKFIDNTTNNGLYGITIVYLVSIIQSLYIVLRQFLFIECLMVSGQRVLDLQTLDQEKQLRTAYDREVGLDKQYEAELDNQEVHQEWPENASLQLSNFSAKYDTDLPLVLKEIKFKVNARQKIGIVGRTGAGKSSIIQALFRMFEPEHGSEFKICQYNALEMGLHSLRQHISVIPQVPFLFKGSVRQNVDPFSISTDEQIWQSLQEAGLRDHVQTLENSLDTKIENTSSCFSMGQKQLLCLARALLRRNKFLVLDEATSNVDMGTDTFIQNVIKTKFADTTVITIAHRLNTIADYDRVVVMSKGRIVEDGMPWELLQKKGMFYEMVKHTKKNAESIIKKAKKYYEQKMTK